MRVVWKAETTVKRARGDIYRLICSFNVQCLFVNNTNRIKRFEKYLTEHKYGKSLKDLTIDDLKKYVEWCKANNLNPYQEFFGVREYYGFLGIEVLSYSCNQVMQMIQLEKFRLKDFMTANQEYARAVSMRTGGSFGIS